MKEIILKNGMISYVDDSVYDFLMSFKFWNFHEKLGVYSCVKGKTIYMHRLLTSCQKGLVVDHINHNKLDNRIKNLRICTQSQNSKNQSKPKNNTSGYKGVRLDSRECLKKRWEAKIKVNRKSIKIGRYLTKEEAARAYDKAAIKYFGEYADLNFKDEK